VTRTGLDRPDMHLAAYPLDLLFDADGSGFEVDVLPAEREDFATAQAVENEQDERRVERIRPGKLCPDGSNLWMGRLICTSCSFSEKDCRSNTDTGMTMDSYFRLGRWLELQTHTNVLAETCR
jgi:hypothetical protein